MENAIHGIFLILGLIIVGCVLLISVYLIISGIPAIRKIGILDFLSEYSCRGKDFLTIERGHNVSRAIQDAFANGHSEICVEREGSRRYG